MSQIHSMRPIFSHDPMPRAKVNVPCARRAFTLLLLSDDSVGAGAALQEKAPQDPKLLPDHQESTTDSAVGRPYGNPQMVGTHLEQQIMTEHK